MTAKDRATLKAQSDATFPSGTANILASDHRVYNQDDIDSSFNVAETGTQAINSDIDTQGNEILNEPNIVASKRNIYAGWNDAPVLTVNAGDNTQFDLTAGVGTFIDLSDPTAPVRTTFNFPGATGVPGTLLGGGIRQTFVTINSAGTILQNGVAPDAFAGETDLFVGNLTHGGVTNNIFDNSQDTPLTDYSLLRSWRQFLRAIKGVNLSGLEYSGVAATLSVKYSAGTGLTLGRNYDTNKEFPDTPQAVAGNAPDIVQKFENLAGDLLTDPAPPTAFVDPNRYRDVATGALVAMTNNNWQIKRIFFFYGSNTTLMYYGNDEYGNKEAALNGIITESFNEHPDSFEAVFRGYLVVKEGATDLTDPAQAEFRTAGGIRPTGGAQGLTTVVSLQDAYDNGKDILTNPSFGPVDIQQGSGADADPILRGQNGAGTSTFTVNGKGDVVGNTLVVEELNTQDTTNDALQSFQVKNTVGTVNIHGKGNGEFTAINFIGSAGAVGAGITGVMKVVEDNGTPLTSRPVLNFLNATSVVDNPGNNSIDVTLPGGAPYDTIEMQYYSDTTVSGSIIEVPRAYTKMIGKGYTTVELVGIRGFCDDISASFAGDLDVSIYRRTPDNAVGRGIGDGTLITTQTIRSTGAAVSTVFDGDLSLDLQSSPVDFSAAVGQIIYLDISAINGWFLKNPAFTLVFRAS
jgi:hypothetical protein